jgi:hypothetical protein
MIHLDRRMRVNANPEHKSLYRWAITEVDSKGTIIGEDQIPWGWTQFFTANSCVLSDEIRFEEFQDEDNPTQNKNPASTQAIRAQLSPSAPNNKKHRITSYTMFGSDREIKHFQLDIRPITEHGEREHCQAWGCVSSTYEVDFLDETCPDMVVFTLVISKDDFSRLAKKVSAGEVDRIDFSVSRARGFYAEWSPGISTRHIKVLTPDKEEHAIEAPAGFTYEPGRLGKVGSAELSVNRKIDIALATEADAEDIEPPPIAREGGFPTPQAQNLIRPAEGQVLKLVNSLTNAAWLLVLLQALIVGVLLNR